MALSLTQFQHLCRLAKLEPDSADQETFAAQCAEILAYIDKLSEVDTAGVEPLYALSGDPESDFRPWREDIARRSNARNGILAGAPESDGDFFVVPRIVEGK